MKSEEMFKGSAGKARSGERIQGTDLWTDRETVLLAGALRGAGIQFEAHCTVNAVRSFEAGNTSYVLTPFAIHGEARNIPDGKYTVTFAGRTARTQRYRGVWIF